jgi:ABC-type multidrug transport system fused ATPase/permease subunit
MSPSASTLTLLRALWSALAPRHRRRLLGVSAATLLCSALELAMLIALQGFLVRATRVDAGAGLWSELGPALLAFLACATGATLGRLLTLWQNDRLVLDTAGDFSVRLFGAALTQRYSDHVQRETAELFAGLDKVQALVNATFAPLTHAVTGACIASALLAYMTWIAPLVTLLGVVLLVLLYLLIAIVADSRLKQRSGTIARLASERMKAVHEAQSGFREIVLSRAQRTVMDHFSETESAFRRGQAETRFFAGAPRYGVELALLMAVCGLASYWSGREGGLAVMIPVAGALALAAQRLIPLVHQAYTAWGHFVGNSKVLADVLALMQRAGPAPGPETPAPLPFEHELRLDGVRLAYPGRGEVLRGIDLRVPKGARVGLVGATGSGKSSLLDLILGLVEPDQGSIRVDGVALDSAERRAAWMARLAFVPQSIYLPDWPLRDVIAFPQREGEIDHARLAHAIAGAQLSEFVALLPDGLDTRPGDSGIRLSGGQRQRIALARALYRRAALLVLDEATGQLDPETEQGVLDTLQRIDRDVTVIVVAHRESALRDCDPVLELREGRLVPTATRATSAAATQEQAL